MRNSTSPSPSVTDTASLRPDSAGTTAHKANQMSPSDVAEPSPMDNSSTVATELEDDAAADLQRPRPRDAAQQLENLQLSTTLFGSQHEEVEEVHSAIYAPEIFPMEAPTASSLTLQHLPPVQTDIKPDGFSLEGATPQAQDLQDVISGSSHVRSSSSSSLENIEEHIEAEMDDADRDLIGEHLFSRAQLRQRRNEVERLNLLLSTAWTSCLELGSYNSRCRRRNIGSSVDSDTNVLAWQSCWKLCERLYHDETSGQDTLNIHDGLDLCRKFCHALFELRSRNDETTDSILRVNFELTKHVQDQIKLPEVFRERTLDFYVTLCYRLMKKRNEVNDENDRILKACWALTKVLLSMRRNRRDGQKTDENLLLAAIEATYNVNDLFRKVLSASRSGRSMAKRRQDGFYHSPEQSGRESRSSNQSRRSRGEISRKSSFLEYPRKTMIVPETPVTEFEDTAFSPESRHSHERGSTMAVGGRSEGRWSSSNGSNTSLYSRRSNRTSSTARTREMMKDDEAKTGQDVGVARGGAARHPRGARGAHGGWRDAVKAGDAASEKQADNPDGRVCRGNESCLVGGSCEGGGAGPVPVGVDD